MFGPEFHSSLTEPGNVKMKRSGSAICSPATVRSTFMVAPFVVCATKLPSVGFEESQSRVSLALQHMYSNMAIQ